MNGTKTTQETKTVWGGGKQLRHEKKYRYGTRLKKQNKKIHTATQPAKKHEKKKRHLETVNFVHEGYVLLHRESESLRQQGHRVRGHEAVLGQVLDVLRGPVPSFVVCGQFSVRHGAHTLPLVHNASDRCFFGEIKELPQVVVPVGGKQEPGDGGGEGNGEGRRAGGGE